MLPFVKTPVRSWPEFVQGVSRLESTSWIFRGGLEHWSAQTTLERALKAWNIPREQAAEAERRLVRDFQRHPEVRHSGVDREDYLAWFALMQHYGAPTRLLDWTYSPFIAAFFALDALFQAETRPIEGQPKNAVVWALNARWLAEAVRGVLSEGDWQLCQDRKAPRSFKNLFVERRPPVRFVSTATPLQLNERLSIQQGVFLCPGDVSASWLDNLRVVDFGSDEMHARAFVLPRELMPAAFEGLQRMNVTARSLFRGLDGYARSMNHRLKLLLDIPLAETEI